MPGNSNQGEALRTIRKRGKPLSAEEKWMVVSVFSRCDEERRQGHAVRIIDPYQRTASYTGVGRRQVVEIMHHFRETGQIPPARRAGNHTTHATTIPSGTDADLRTFILSQHRDGIAINARHVQDFLLERLGRTIPEQTIRDHLQRLGFHYTRTRTKSRSLREKAYIRQQRHTFLHDLHRLREAGYQVIYVDESFLHHHHGNEYSWFSDGDFLERPTGKGRRWCFIHAMSEAGLVPNVSRIFEAKKSRGDYHNMFNAESFLGWWDDQLLPNLRSHCVIVVDRATYHLVPEVQITPSTMRKAELQQWLSNHSIAWEPHWLRPRLQQEVDQHIDKTPWMTKLAAAHGHQVLLLPVHHPELNPIELVWAIVKNDCARQLRAGLKFKEVRQHLEGALANISAATCSKLYERVRQTERTYWQLDVDLDDDIFEETHGEQDDESCVAI